MSATPAANREQPPADDPQVRPSQRGSSAANKAKFGPEDRRALGWLWDHFLRKRLVALLVLSALVTLHGLAMVGFLATMRGSFTAFFDSSNGAYEFKDAPMAPGTYGFTAQVRNEAGTVSAPASFSVSVGEADAASMNNQVLLPLDPKAMQSDGRLAFTPEQVWALFGNPGGLEISEVGGPNADKVTFVGRQSSSVLLWMVVSLTALILLRALAAFVAGRMAARLATQASLDMRTKLIDRLISLDLAYFDSAPSGRLVLRLYGLVAKLETFFSRTMVVSAQHAVSILLILVYLAWVHAGLFVFVLLALPLALWGVRLVTRRVRAYATRTNDALADFIAGMENTITGIRTIKLTNQSRRAASRLTDYSRDISRLQYGIGRNQALLTPFIDLLAAFAIITIVGLGGLAVIQGWAGLQAATLVTFVIGLGLIFDPARALSRFNALLADLIVALREVHGLDLERASITDAPEAQDGFDAGGDIVFDKVSFSYTPDRPLFEDLSFSLSGGKTAAFVGATGSGKTSILSLLARLYEPKTGEVKIGGLPIQSLRAESLRGAFSVVSQDIFIFDASIEENILFVAPDASAQDVQEAAAKAELTDLIAEKGQETVGPRGAQLSGGQRQRIAIARAFLKSAPIILLDEATSALDQRTEAKITAALKSLSAGKTTIIIAHRLSTIVHADSILVLEAGKVAEQGTHADLIAQGGLYAALYRAQEAVGGSHDAARSPKPSRPPQRRGFWGRRS